MDLAAAVDVNGLGLLDGAAVALLGLDDVTGIAVDGAQDQLSDALQGGNANALAVWKKEKDDLIQQSPIQVYEV